MAMYWVVNTSRGQHQVYAPTAQQAATITFQQTGETVPPPSGQGSPTRIEGIPEIQAGSGGSFADQWSGSGLASDATGPASGLAGQDTPPPAPPGGPGNVLGGLERVAPVAAYRRGLQRQGIPESGILSSYLSELYGPAAATFGVQQALGQTPYTDLENAFQHFVTESPVGGTRQRATNAFNALTTGAANTNEALARYRDPYAEARQGGEVDDDALSDIFSLAGQAAATKYSPFAARRLLRSPGRVQSLYEQGGFEGNILDHIRKLYGL